MSKVIKKIQDFIGLKAKIPEYSFETDINTIIHDLQEYGGGTRDTANGVIVANAVGEGIGAHFFLTENVYISSERPITSTVSWIRKDAGGDTVTGGVTLAATKLDGSEATQFITGNGNPWDTISFDACGDGRYEKYTYVWESGYEAGDQILLRFTVEEAAKTFWFLGITTKYYVRRVLS